MIMKEKIAERIVRMILFLIVLAFLGWAFTSGAFQYMFDNLSDLLNLIKQHAKLVALSSLLAVMISVPLGIFITRPQFKKFDWVVLNLANLGQTIPSLAVLALVMSYLGLGYGSAVFALWVYSILPILRNTVAGIESVSPAILDAGKGIGMTKGQVLLKLEIPNAIFPILAGIRTSIVINIGTAALAFLIGGGGLGDWIFTGISMHDTGIMLSGAFPITVFAVSIDFLLGRFERWIVPKGLQRSIEITE
jgi:osmoprotectant transport system permease protein